MDTIVGCINLSFGQQSALFYTASSSLRPIIKQPSFKNIYITVQKKAMWLSIVNLLGICHIF